MRKQVNALRLRSIRVKRLTCSSVQIQALRPGGVMIGPQNARSTRVGQSPLLRGQRIEKRNYAAGTRISSMAAFRLAASVSWASGVNFSPWLVR